MAVVPSAGYNLFMSHTWVSDSQGRSTHERAAALRHELKRLGWKVWFDEDQLIAGHSLDAQLAAGILSSDAVCVCVTRAYCEKVNSANARDNVYKEWNFCQSLGKMIIPIIFEQDMLSVAAWPPGIMSMVLGNTFYIDASCDKKVRGTATKVSRMLKLLGLRQKHSLSFRSRPSRPLIQPRTEIRI